MSGIVCAVRGGPASRPTIARAISLAQETGLPLRFLYIVNLDFLTHTASSRIQTISEEMAEMGEFILLAAQDVAQQAGVTADGVVRHGSVKEELVGFCQEVEADYLVLGRPQTEQEQNVFTLVMMAQFMQEIEGLTGAEVLLPAGDMQ